MPTLTSLVATALALSSLALTHHHSHGSPQNVDRYPSIPRSLNRRWESSHLVASAGHSNHPRSDVGLRSDSESADTTLGGTPTNAIPRHYNLTIQPDFEGLTFNGSVIIDLDIAHDSDSIFLNTRNITLTGWEVELGPSEDGTDVQQLPDDASVTETDSGMIFSPGGKLLAGSTVTMSISYQGVIFPAEEAFGLFQSPYTKEDGSTGMTVLTQLEMDGARRVFPCLDDPSLKAEFTVSLISAESHTFISNMDVDTESKVGENKKVTFNISPPMSTYLLAVAVGDLNFAESTGFRVPIRAYGSAGRDMETSKYALGVAVEGMKQFEEVLGIEYPLPKIDHLAVEGSAFGGMENWGLVTLAQDMVFVENGSTPDTRQSTAQIVLHELAHMWFGDLVTLDWWTQVWLNEGFADYFTYWALKASYPELDMAAQMPQWLRQAAMQADSFSDAHPLDIPANTTDMSKPAIFDTISYMKGASVLRMIDAYMGEDNFMEGLRRYLVTNKYDNVVTLDLWSALGEGMEDMWGPWTDNAGHPVVFVVDTEDSIIVEQHRFRWGGNATEAEDGAVFPIPLLLRNADGVDTAVVFNERQATIEVDDPDFFFLNADSAGFYRVAYTPSRLHKLSTQADRLTPADRLGLVHDTVAVASTGHLTAVDALDIIAEFMKADEDYWVWITMLESGVGQAASLWLYDDKISGQFDKFVRTQTSRLVERLGWQEDYWKLENKDDDLLTKFESLIFEYAGLAGEKAIVKAAKEMVAKFPTEGKAAVDPNIQEAAVWIAVKYGGEEEYNTVVAVYEALEAEDLTAKALLLRSLGRTTNEALLERTLGLILDETILPPLKPFIMEGVASSGLGIRVALQWVQGHWSELADSGAEPATILVKLVAKLTRREDVEALSSWMMDPTRAEYFQDAQPVVDLALATTQWAERDLECVKGWLAKD